MDRKEYYALNEPRRPMAGPHEQHPASSSSAEGCSAENVSETGGRPDYFDQLERENDYLRNRLHSLLSGQVKSASGMNRWMYEAADDQASNQGSSSDSAKQNSSSRTPNRFRSSSLQGNSPSSLHRSPALLHLHTAAQCDTQQQVDNQPYSTVANKYADFRESDLNSNLSPCGGPAGRSSSICIVDGHQQHPATDTYPASFPKQTTTISQQHNNSNNQLQQHQSRANFVHERLQYLESELAKAGGRSSPPAAVGPAGRRVSWSNRHHMISPVVGARVRVEEGATDASRGAAVQPTGGFVQQLETKVQDLERKYEVQAAKHRQLTHELTKLRRQASAGELDKISAEAQTSPEEGSLPSPQQFNTSPIRSHRYSPHSLHKGASYGVVCSASSSREYPGRLRPASPPTASHYTTAPTFTASLSPRGAVASHCELINWLGNRPAARLFRAKYQYVPIRDSPNEHPQLELALQPGDYLVVEGDLDEDLFYEAELFSGERGLVPSNYVERVPDHQIYDLHNLPQHSTYRESAPAVPRRQSTHRRVFKEFAGRSGANPHPVLPPGVRSSMVMPWSERFESGGESDSPPMPLPESICPYPSVDVSGITVHEVRQMEGSRVPCPRELLVERQLCKSVVISWSPPENSLMPITQYHVCVDGNVKAVVPASYKTKALIEDVQLNFAHRISVRSVTEAGYSADAACSVTVGKDVCVAPEDVRASQLTPLSVQISWYPANTNCEHVILLNGLKVGVCPPAVFQVQLKGLLPSTMYRCSVRAKYPRAVLEEKPVESYVDFKTLPKIGLPDAPNRVQCESGPQDGTLLITWMPVSNQPRPPSRAAVAGYLIYADGKKVTEINSPTSDHALLRLSEFADDPPLFITVRTRTREGAVSADSNVVRVPRHLQLNVPKSSPKLDYSIAQQQTTTMPAALGSAGSGSYPGLLMVQPTSGQQQPMQQPMQQAMQQPVQQSMSQVAQPGGNVYPVTVTLPLVLPNLITTTAAAFQPIHNQLPVYSVPIGTGTSGVTYTAPSAGHVTTTPALATPAAITGIMGAPVPGTANQYYIFHPRLTKTDPTINDKPSLLEMENSYLVKHQLGGPSYPPVRAPPARLMYPSGQPQQQYAQAAAFNARALPVINPATGIPFSRSDQYAQAWQTLSPATRRRLEQYMSQPTVSPLVQDPNLRRQELLQRRAAWRKRSFSADEELERSMPQVPYNYYNELAPVPQIQITGASGSEGPGSVVDFGEDDWDLPYSTKPSARFRKRYYQTRASSRAHSEPDLRVEPRLGMAAGHRLFVALYDYDPTHMSPNPNAAHDELAFRKGQVLKVVGDRDMDGFYRGELNGRWGLLPSNMVQEMDRQSAYAFLDQRFGALNVRDPRRAAFGTHRGVSMSMAVPPPYDPYDNTGYTDYESSASADRYPPISAAQHPRVRRMRFGQAKSRSYDYGDVHDPTRPTPARRLVDEFGAPAYSALRGMGGGSADPDYDRDRYRRNPFRDPLDDPTRHYSGPPAFRDRPREQPYDYRGSLDRRSFARDSSLPARSPSEQDFLDRRRVPPYDTRADPYTSRTAYDATKPRFEVGEGRDADYDRRFARDRTFERDRRYPEAERPYPAPYGSSEDRDRRAPDDRRLPDDRYRESSDRRRADYPADRREAPLSARSAPEEFRSSYQPSSSRELPSSSRQQPTTNSSGPYYPEQGREREPRGRQGSFRRGGRDGLEQNIREAVRETPARAMVARFDYDPRQTSPNVDAEQVELTFRNGDVIMVYGEMDDDGFYIGELRGKRGLVPSNFLDPADGQQEPAQSQQPIPLPPAYDQEPIEEFEPEPAQPSRRKADGVTFSDTVLAKPVASPKTSATKPPAGAKAAGGGGTKKTGPGGAQLKKMDSTVGAGKPAAKKPSAAAGAAPRKASQPGAGAKATPAKKKA